MTEKKKILSVLAHPDDESFGMGGTLALYAQQGVEVHLICATRGEAGEVDPVFLDGYQSIAERREDELRCAANYLGLTKVHFLEYRDSGMEGSADNQHPDAFINAPLEKVTEQVVNYIREIKPQVVLTFDPVGGYHHPDHIHAHNAAVKAFHAAGDPNYAPNGRRPYQPEKLYYHVFPRGAVRVLIKILKFFGRDTTKFGRNKDINLDLLAGDEDYPAHVVINYRKVGHLKDQASACHASQLDFGRQAPSFLSWLRRLTGGKDSFMRAYPPVEGTYKRRDLFAD
jgi:LmbE family N-acetylglucosaminyl deacetylase